MGIPADRIRVLHVDDDTESAGMAGTLSERGDDRFAVETVTSADAGLNRLADAAFDCIVSGYELPGMDGIELLVAVRDEYPDLPFILFTGTGSEGVASEAISAGATDYLEKRSGTDQSTLLANRVENAVEQYRLQRERERTVTRTTDAVLRVSPDWQITFVNDQTTTLYGMTEAEMLGQPFWELFADIRGTSLADSYRAVMDTREAASLEAQTEVLDGWFHIDVYPNPDGGLSFYFRDVTERKERELELQHQRDRYRSLFENNPLIIWEEDQSEAKEYLDALAAEVADVESYLLSNPQEIDRLTERVEVIDINQNAVDYYDAPSKEAVIDNLQELFVEETLDVLAAQWAAIADGETRFRAETASRTLSGDRREELLDIFVPENHADDYSRVYVIGTDITERKERERRLQRQNERLDKFTSVVSHDLRNPLNVASARLELATDECDSPHLQDVADAHTRMEHLIDDLLTFARAGSEAIDRRTVALPRLLEGCWETLQGEDASLVVETGRGILADRDRLQQLVENLLANAVDHGGTGVTVRVGDLPDGFYVEDDGPGIPPEQREDVFGAGYSSTRGGTGFGLSIVEQVAEAHGWTVRVTDGSDGGARFEVTGVEFPE